MFISFSFGLKVNYESLLCLCKCRDSFDTGQIYMDSRFYVGFFTLVCCSLFLSKYCNIAHLLNHQLYIYYIHFFFLMHNFLLFFFKNISSALLWLLL